MISVAVLAIQCGLAVDEAVLEAIVQVESRGNPYALSVNGGLDLVRQPRDRDEAVSTARWLERHGYNFDAGLGQVNSVNLARLGLDATSVFEPCANLEAASRVLHECYDRAAQRWGEGETALVAALSCYNTGDFTRGVLNGYVDAVRSSASGPLVIRGRLRRDAEAGVCSAPPPRWARSGPDAQAHRLREERRVPGRRRDTELREVRAAEAFGEPLADVFGEGRQ